MIRDIDRSSFFPTEPWRGSKLGVNCYWEPKKWPTKKCYQEKRALSGTLSAEQPGQQALAPPCVDCSLQSWLQAGTTRLALSREEGLPGSAQGAGVQASK